MLNAGRPKLFAFLFRPSNVSPALLEKLRASIPVKRFVHTVGVAAEAARLARLHDADPDRAELAGWLHDCAKGIPVEDQVATCDRLGVPLDDWTRACPPVVHGFLGAFLARRDYGVEDEAVLQAIRRHTVGAPGMTPLDKVVFVADLVEPGRAFEGVAELRALAERDLDEAILVSIERQLALNAARRRPLHPAMLLVWNDILAKKGKP